VIRPWPSCRLQQPLGVVYSQHGRYVTAPLDVFGVLRTSFARFECPVWIGIDRSDPLAKLHAADVSYVDIDDGFILSGLQPA
jgi:hypothetical protein